ncbi:MAG TPA: ATP-binding protein [Pilimelia sp.]|nr:ATP-binding protein [Pilimelia sp.]
MSPTRMDVAETTAESATTERTSGPAAGGPALGPALAAAVGLSLVLAVLAVLGARAERTELRDWVILALVGGNTAILAGFGTVATRRAAGLERDRRAAENEMRASHNQLQELIDHTSANIYMKRVDNGRYLLVNREWERLFKVRREEVVNLTDHGVFPTGLADQLRANDLAVAGRRKPVQYEETAGTDAGERTYLSVKFPVFDATGTPYAVCGISTDITERKRAEEEIRHLNADLEARVRERTAELEASNGELDAFAYSVSHDLRAPLRSLHGFSDALIEDYDSVLDDTGRDYLRRLQSNVKRMGRMIDDLLDLSRATRAELHRDDVDITCLAQELFVELAGLDPHRTVRTRVADGLCASGDRQLLRLMLQNLLANAWKFSAKRPDATIEVDQVDRDGGRFFVVRDNGAGFDMRYADKLFTAFQRLHATSDFEGTGIGLAIVARIVHRHGGRIFAEAAVDSGAAFYFSLKPESGGLA